jgi:hypothetical protein
LKSQAVKFSPGLKNKSSKVSFDLSQLPAKAVTVKDLISEDKLFDNLSELITPEIAAEVLHTTRATVYQWHSRPKKYDVPVGLFIKLGRKLLIRRDVLKTWVLSRQPKERPV